MLFTIKVTANCPLSEIHPLDTSIAGSYQCYAGEASQQNHHISDIAIYILNAFHYSHAIKCVNNFDIRVFDFKNTEIIPNTNLKSLQPLYLFHFTRN